MMTVKMEEILQRDGNQAADRVAEHVQRNPGKVRALVGLLESNSKRVKNASAKAVREVSENRPELLADDYPRFVALLSSPDTILRWIAIDVVGNLAAGDSKLPVGKKILGELYDGLRDESMITAGHAVATLGKLAHARPRLRRPITDELSRVDRVPRNRDCRSILRGKVADAFAEFAHETTGTVRKEIDACLTRYSRDERAATRKKASRVRTQLQEA